MQHAKFKQCNLLSNSHGLHFDFCISNYGRELFHQPPRELSHSGMAISPTVSITMHASDVLEVLPSDVTHRRDSCPLPWRHDTNSRRHLLLRNVHRDGLPVGTDPWAAEVSTGSSSTPGDWRGRRSASSSERGVRPRGNGSGAPTPQTATEPVQPAWPQRLAWLLWLVCEST
jgi:hypothetical protein